MTGSADLSLPRTYDWAKSANGRLTDAERRAIRAGIRAGYGTMARGLVSWPVRRRGKSSGLPAAPDSRLAAAAREASAEQGAALNGHGHRTFILGQALIDVDGATLDPELFYAVALLHDSGMMREVVGEDFTVRSGENLIELCAGAGVSDSVGHTLADAAVGHATPGLSASEDPIAFYVQAGAMADLAGLRMWDLPRGLVRQAYAAHPSHGVHRSIPGLIRREAASVPDGRFAMLKKAGMDHMVLISPTRLIARVAERGSGRVASPR